MNFNTVNVVMFGVGAILIYAAIKDKSPKDVITDALSSNSAAGKKKPAHTKASTTPTAPAGSHVRGDYSQPRQPAPIVTSN